MNIRYNDKGRHITFLQKSYVYEPPYRNHNAISHKRNLEKASSERSGVFARFELSAHIKFQTVKQKLWTEVELA